MILLTETSQMMTIMATAAVLLAMLRWRTAGNRMLLLAFVMVMLGSIVREVALMLYGTGYGSYGWPAEAKALSAFGRILKMLASCLFVREATKERYGEWMWSVFALLAFVGALLWR